MSVACRLIVDSEPRSGRWNMAIDEVLLGSAVAHNACSFRVYEWLEPTLSLGYFQCDTDAIDERFASLPRVRRLSGGGALLHHFEVTYACAVPATHRLSRVPSTIYDCVHREIIRVLGDLGITARLRGEPVSADGERPFLCFQRSDARDILVSGQKVVGSAQRRRRGAVLQHGSLVLQHSPLVPEICGLDDICDAPDAADVRKAVASSCWRAIADEAKSAELTATETRQARRLVEAGYTLQTGRAGRS